MDTEQAIWQKLEYIASLLERDLEAEGWTGKTVTLTFKLDTFQGMFRAHIFHARITKYLCSLYAYEVVLEVDI